MTRGIARYIRQHGFLVIHVQQTELSSVSGLSYVARKAASLEVGKLRRWQTEEV